MMSPAEVIDGERAIGSRTAVRAVGADYRDDEREPWQQGPPKGWDDEFDAEVLSAPNPAAPKWKVWTSEEIWAPLPPTEYAIGGVLPRTGLALIVAFGSSLKSWLEVDLLIAKAIGAKWLGLFDCAAGPVLFVDYESGDHEARRRLQAVSRARGLVGPVHGVSMISMPSLFFTAEDFEPEVRKLAAVFSLITFDTISAGSCDVDENDPRFARGLNVLKRLGPETGCTFVVLHHSRKSKTEGGGDEREAVRGSGAIFAAADVVLQISRFEDGEFLVRQTKARGGKAVEPFLVRVTDGADGAIHVTGKAAELPAPTTERGAAKAAAHSKQVEDDIKVVVRKLLDNPGVPGLRALRATVRGKPNPYAIGNDRLDVVLATLGIDDDGTDKRARIENRGTPGRPRWHLRTERHAESEQDHADS